MTDKHSKRQALITRHLIMAYFIFGHKSFFHLPRFNWWGASQMDSFLCYLETLELCALEPKLATWECYVRLILHALRNSAMWSLPNQSLAHDGKTHKHSVQTLQWIQFLTWYSKCRPNLRRQYTHVHPCSSVNCCLYTSVLACISRHLPRVFTKSNKTIRWLPLLDSPHALKMRDQSSSERELSHSTECVR